MTIWILFFIIVSVIVLSIPFLQGSERRVGHQGPDGEAAFGNESEPD